MSECFPVHTINHTANPHPHPHPHPTFPFKPLQVYGCALYVAKRDALADPGFMPFAALSAEELRSSDKFYQYLMMNEEEGRTNDLTLFIKTNMQLGTEVMRNSLDADWKLLTPVHKHALISSSLNPRDAEDRMLRKINSNDNPSRCSCGQVAPDEYEADATCCARGTELVFTWRKNGDLELRLDGRIMDTFPDPELARGIFYEYLRGDDPMSMQARDNFVDGFPFLLAPLAQVRGISSPVLPHDGTTQETRKTAQQVDKKTLRVLGSVGDFVNSHLTSATDWVKSNAEEMRVNTITAAKTVGDSARNLSTELEKRRVMAWEHMVGLPEEASRLLASRIPFLAPHLLLRGKLHSADNSHEETENLNERDILNRTNGGVIRTQKKRFFQKEKEEVTDEIGIIINPTMNFTHRMFLYLVHFYLMLLLIVSVPGSYYTRLVVKRTGGSRSKSLTDDEEMSSGDGAFCFGKRDEPRLHGLELSVKVSDRQCLSTSGMTKSLSYYL